MSSYAYNELCEIEVYGEYKYTYVNILKFIINVQIMSILFSSNYSILIGCQGNYRNGCLYACPTNCLNEECDAYIGHCLSCLPGYHGQFCGNGLNFLILLKKNYSFW